MGAINTLANCLVINNLVMQISYSKVDLNCNLDFPQIILTVKVVLVSSFMVKEVPALLFSKKFK